MKLLIDMNLSPLWIEFLSASGFESVHWSQIGDPAAPDGIIMDYAAANGFVISRTISISAPCSQTVSLASPALFRSGHRTFSLRQSARS